VSFNASLILLFRSKVLFLIKLSLLSRLFIAILQFGLHIFPHGESQVVDGILGKLIIFLRLSPPHFLLVDHSLILKRVTKHFILSFELEQFILEVGDGAFEIVEL
jgi:hypothetical protein